MAGSNVQQITHLLGMMGEMALLWLLLRGSRSRTTTKAGCGG
jgi:hypothetical protein